MKTVKFMMMLLCGALLSVGFSACSSSNDDGNGSNNGNANTKLEGTFTIDGKSYNVAYGCYSTKNNTVKIEFTSYDDKSNTTVPNYWSYVSIYITTDKLAIPEGSVTSYEIYGGLGNNTDDPTKTEYRITSYHAMYDEYIPYGTRPCEITKNGDIYTINIPEMSIKYSKGIGSSMFNTTCSLKFVGKIPYHGHDIH